MRRFRRPLRLRTALALVAVAAAALGAARLARTRAEFLNRAEFHAGWEAHERDNEKTWDGYIDEADQNLGKVGAGEHIDTILALSRELKAQCSENKALSHARAEYHVALRRKYERAASRPWLSTPPDPPMPFADQDQFTRWEWERQREKYPWLPERPEGGFFEGPRPPPQPIHWP